MNKMVGQRIKTRRKALHLTQVEIKEKTGISSGNLSDLENGNRLPSAAALISLSEVLNCSIDWLLKGDSPGKENRLELNPMEESFINCFHQLSSEEQMETLSFINNKLRLKRSKESQERFRICTSEDTSAMA